MNLEYFIAKKVAEANKQSFSRMIIRIAIAAIAVCLAVMIGATAMISGFKKEISSKIFGFNGHIQITAAAAANNRNITEESNIPIDKDQYFYHDIAEIGQISYLAKRAIFGMELPGEYEVETNGGVKHIQVYALKPGIIKTKDAIEGIAIKGLGDDYDWGFMEQFLQSGEILPLKSEKAERGIMISQQTADRLDIEVGQKFIVYFRDLRGDGQIPRRLTVKGIFKTGLVDFDKGFALVDIRLLQELNLWEPNQVGGFEIILDNLDDLDVMTEYIYDKVPSHLWGENIKKILSFFFGWLDFQDINEVVILTMMIAVCIINMITALLILILERTNMIGILKALGATDWSIRKVFLYHAAYIIFLGLLYGNLLGIGFCLLEDYFHFIKLSEENYYLSYAPINLEFFTIAALNIGTLALTVVFLIIPTYLITKISPVKAIRFN